MEVRGIVLNGSMGSGKDTLGAHIGNAYGYEKASLAAPLYAVAEHAGHYMQGRHAEYSLARTHQALDSMLGSSLSAAGVPLAPVDIAAAVRGVIELAGTTDLLDPTIEKPRAFLQGLGDLVRGYRRSALPDHLMRRVLARSVDSWLEDGVFRFIVTDARYGWEMDDIRDAAALLPAVMGSGTGVSLSFVKLSVSPATVVERISSRDGTTREDILAALEHPNEKELRSIPDSYFDRVIDGDRSLESVYRAADEMVRESGYRR